MGPRRKAVGTEIADEIRYQLAGPVEGGLAAAGRGVEVCRSACCACREGGGGGGRGAEAAERGDLGGCQGVDVAAAGCVGWWRGECYEGWLWGGDCALGGFVVEVVADEGVLDFGGGGD